VPEKSVILVATILIEDSWDVWE